MMKRMLYGVSAAVGLSVLAGNVAAVKVLASSHEEIRYVPPVVFQAAGPNAASIQGTVDAFRAAIGGANNGGAPGSQPNGRREINWDGGGAATTLSPTPFDFFLTIRGARFITDGRGFVQAPPEGIATTFNNPSYARIFKAFSPLRLFSPVESNVTDTRFFVPGGGELPATTNAFGAIFSDVDSQGTQVKGKGRAATTMVFYGTDGKPLYRAVVPASEGDASFSFLGVLFDKAQVAHVRIKTGNVKPGVDDGGRHDVVMMDDFIFGEPQAVPAYQVPDVVDAVEDDK